MPESQLKKTVRNKGLMWRLVINGWLNYTDAKNMTYEELKEAEKAVELFGNRPQK